MVVEFYCECGQHLRAKPEAAGHHCRCKGCGQILQVPQPYPEGEPPPIVHPVAPTGMQQSAVPGSAKTGTPAFASEPPRRTEAPAANLSAQLAAMPADLWNSQPPIAVPSPGSIPGRSSAQPAVAPQSANVPPATINPTLAMHGAVGVNPSASAQYAPAAVQAFPAVPQPIPAQPAMPLPMYAPAPQSGYMPQQPMMPGMQMQMPPGGVPQAGQQIWYQTAGAYSFSPTAHLPPPQPVPADEPGKSAGKPLLTIPAATLAGAGVGLLIGAFICGVSGYMQTHPLVGAGTYFTWLLLPAVVGAAIGFGIATLMAARAKRQQEKLRQSANFRADIAHDLIAFSPGLLAAATLATSGAFGVCWLALIHGRLPRNRFDDPSGGKALGFLFIPFYNLYWFFFVNLRLCTRLEETFAHAGVPKKMPRGLMITMMICRLAFLADLLNLFFLPFLVYRIQSNINELVAATRGGTRPAPHAVGRRNGALVTAVIFCGLWFLPLLVLNGVVLYNTPTFPSAWIKVYGDYDDHILATSGDLDTLVFSTRGNWGRSSENDYETTATASKGSYGGSSYVEPDRPGAGIQLWRMGGASPVQSLPYQGGATAFRSADGQRFAIVQPGKFTLIGSDGQVVARHEVKAEPGREYLKSQMPIGLVENDELLLRTTDSQKLHIMSLKTGAVREEPFDPYREPIEYSYDSGGYKPMESPSMPGDPSPGGATRLRRRWYANPNSSSHFSGGGPVVSADGKVRAVPGTGYSGYDSRDNIRILETATGKTRVVIRGESTESLALSGDGKILAVGSYNSKQGITTWDTTTGQMISKLAVPTHRPIFISDDGKRLLVMTYKGVVRYDMPR